MKSPESKKVFIDPFLEEMILLKEIQISTRNCCSWQDSCIKIKYKVKSGLVAEHDRLRTKDPIEIEYDCLWQVPNYIRPNNRVPEPIYQSKIVKRNKVLILHWYENYFPDVLDSTRYIFNDEGKVILIENNIDFLSPSIIYKFSMGFNSFTLTDSLIYSNDQLIKKITKCGIRNNRRDTYNVVPLVSVTNYTYDSDNKLTKIFTVHKFKDSSQNYNCEIFFENGLPKYKIENNIRQEYYIKSL